MKTAQERASELVESWYPGNSDDALAGYLVDLVVAALKEQDKLTRHAIADAINAEYNGEYITYGEHIALSRAHSIAMNTSAL